MAIKSAAPARRSGRGKWIFAGAVAFAGFIAVETGWAGFGFAHLKSRVYPNDTALLGWVPASTSSVVILDPHQIDLPSLGPEGSIVRNAIARTREDVKRVTGIDLAYDIDKIVVTPTLIVARGRFDPKKLADKLAEHRYTEIRYRGEAYLARTGEDAIGILDGSIALYGDETAVRAAIDAHASGPSLEKSEAVTSRLASLGWRHAALTSVQLVDDKPSLRAMLAGTAGPRAVTVGLTTKEGGVDAEGAVEAASPSNADELTKQLEEQRKSAETVSGLLTDPSKTEPSGGLADALGKIAKSGAVTHPAGASEVRLHGHITPAELETVAKNLRALKPFVEAEARVRLLQLLFGGP